VKDIARLIEQDCTRYGDSDGTGSHVTVDTARRYQLVYRYNYIKHSLRPFGYDFTLHPQLTARLVYTIDSLKINILRSLWYTSTSMCCLKSISCSFCFLFLLLWLGCPQLSVEVFWGLSVYNFLNEF